MSTEWIKTLHDRRNKAHEEARAIAERAQIARRTMTGEETQAYERANREIAETDARIREWRDDALSRATADRARRGVEHLVRPEVGLGHEGLGDDALARFYNNGFATRASGFLRSTSRRSRS